MAEPQTTEATLDTTREALAINSRRCIAPTGVQRTRFGEIPKYAEGLYDLNHGLYAWLVPNGSWGESNAGLIVGDGQALLVDTLWDLNYTRTMLDAMHPVTEAAPISTVVNSHADGDHCWGNQLMAGADIITSQASFDELRSLFLLILLKDARVNTPRSFFNIYQLLTVPLQNWKPIFI